MKLGQVLQKRLVRALPTGLNLGHQTPLHRVRSGLLLQAVLLDFTLDIEIGQRSKRGLQRRQEIVCVERDLWRASRFSGGAFALQRGKVEEHLRFSCAMVSWLGVIHDARVTALSQSPQELCQQEQQFRAHAAAQP